MKKRILVIEDQEDNRQILRDLLSNAGYEMIEAEDGEKGIAAAARERPDLILMDIQLPILDGYEATRRIKANPELKAIPIIAVTSYCLEWGRRQSGCRRLRRLCAKALQSSRVTRENQRIFAVAFDGKPHRRDANETTRLHHPSRRRGSNVTDCGVGQ